MLGPTVCRLAAGGNRIRTLGPTERKGRSEARQMGFAPLNPRGGSRTALGRVNHRLNGGGPEVRFARETRRWRKADSNSWSQLQWREPTGAAANDICRMIVRQSAIRWRRCRRRDGNGARLMRLAEPGQARFRRRGALVWCSAAASVFRLRPPVTAATRSADAIGFALRALRGVAPARFDAVPPAPSCVSTPPSDQ